MNWKFIRNVLLKALVLFLVFNIVLNVIGTLAGWEKLSIYNWLVPGRERFPFGEVPQKAYNLTIYDIETMFSTHVVERAKAEDEFRVFILGDSSIWGVLLRPEETLAGQLNAMQFTSTDGRRVVFYNLGYPSMSLDKDAIILAYAMRYQPDLILWPITLNSFDNINPEISPIVKENLSFRNKNLRSQLEIYSLERRSYPDILRALFGHRRELADWYRLQLYGLLWAATGIDQDYDAAWTPAQRDFAADDDALFEIERLDYTGVQTHLTDFYLPEETYTHQINEVFWLAGKTPVVIINEPIMVSTGENHDIRYNAYYPVWAYDQYRTLFAEQCRAQGWTCLDAWDLVPEDQFTNSAIHMTPAGEGLFAQFVADYLTTAGLVIK